MATTQMNVRIDEDLKLRGDAVFEKLGYSPTQVVRAVWGFASRNSADLDTVAKMLDEVRRLSDPSVEAERRQRFEAAEEALEIVPAALERMGVDRGSLPLVDLDDEWVEQARYEHAVEKGWLEPERSPGITSGSDNGLWQEVAERMGNE